MQIKVSKKIKALHPIVDTMIKNLSAVDPIRFIRIQPNLLEASSDATAGRNKIPIIKPEHPNITGISVILNLECMEIQFFNIISAKKGYGKRMVEAVMLALPPDWSAFVLMDWSHGFWEHISVNYTNLELV